MPAHSSYKLSYAYLTEMPCHSIPSITQSKGLALHC